MLCMAQVQLNQLMFNLVQWVQLCLWVGAQVNHISAQQLEERTGSVHLKKTAQHRIWRKMTSASSQTMKIVAAEDPLCYQGNIIIFLYRAIHFLIQIELFLSPYGQFSESNSESKTSCNPLWIRSSSLHSGRNIEKLYKYIWDNFSHVQKSRRMKKLKALPVMLIGEAVLFAFHKWSIVRSMKKSSIHFDIGTKTLINGQSP